MKTYLYATCLFGMLMAIGRAGIIANGDFSNGTAHWSGDLKDVTRAQEGSSGLDVNLADHWIKIEQVFNTHAVSLDFEIKYTCSEDLAFVQPPPGTKVPEVPANVFLKTEQNGRRVPPVFIVHPGHWAVVMLDPEENIDTYAEVIPTLGSKEVQTCTGHFPFVMRHEEKKLILLFPPGRGVIHLENVTVTPSAVPYDGKMPADVPKQNP